MGEYIKMEKNFIVGIDPGLSGAISFLSTSRDRIEVYPMPEHKKEKGVQAFNIDEIIHILQEKKDQILSVFIEKQQVFPSQGSVSSGNLMYGYGLLIGIIKASSIPMRVITPKEWKNVLFKGMPPLDNNDKNQLKERSCYVALTLYPDVKDQLLRGKRARKTDHNLAESLLIAEYGVRIWQS